MKRITVSVLVLFLAAIAVAEQRDQVREREGIPRVLKFSATIAPDPAARFEPGVVSVTFSIYKEQSDTTPLWVSTQNVTIDEYGRFTVLLGGSEENGLPLDLFTSGEAHWLGVQRIPERERERIMLASVPYALKAADAETLGGKPLSAFVLNPENDTTGAKTKFKPRELGTAGFLAKFIDSVNIDSSILFESSGKIGLSTMSPQGPLHINSVMTYRNGGVGSIQTGTNPGIMLENPGSNSTVLLSENFGLVVFASTSATAPLSGTDLRFVIRPTGNVGIGISNPLAPLHIGATQLYRNLNLAAVQRGTNPGLLLEDSGTNTSVALTENNGLQIYTTPSSSLPFAGSDLRMVVTIAGDVGIGTAAPAAKVNVIGNNGADNLSGNGFDGPQVLRVIGGHGGAGSLNGGAGAPVLIQAGDGGAGPQSVNKSGEGGSITLKPGSPGPGGDSAGAIGNVIVNTAGSGIVLKSPNGLVCARLTIDNTGTLVVGGITCPP